MQFESILCDGAFVKEVRLPWKRADRPIWKTAEALNIHVAVRLMDRFATMESFFVEWALASVFESVFKMQIPSRAEALRTLFSEIQRLLWSFDYLEKIFTALENPQRKQSFARLKELIFQAQDQILGARIFPNYICIGGVKQDFSVGDHRKIKELILLLQDGFKLSMYGVDKDLIVQNRLKGLLAISYNAVSSLMIGGPIGHASGLILDLRLQKQYGFYPQLKLELYDLNKTSLIKEFGFIDDKVKGDTLKRIDAVIFQINQSFNLIYDISENIPEGSIHFEFNKDEYQNPPSGFHVYGVEGASGPIYAGIADKHLRVSTNSVRMANGIEHLLKGVHREDLNLAYASLGYDHNQGDLG